jgi:hypothetical protein
MVGNRESKFLMAIKRDRLFFLLYNLGFTILMIWLLTDIVANGVYIDAKDPAALPVDQVRASLQSMMLTMAYAGGLGGVEKVFNWRLFLPGDVICPLKCSGDAVRITGGSDTARRSRALQIVTPIHLPGNVLEYSA